MTKGTSKAVLCVGNDPIGLNLRRASLKSSGWRLLSATSGHEGIILCGQESVDAVVLDLGEDGVEAALTTGELKRLHPSLPIVVLVARGKKVTPDATRQADVVVLKHHESWILPDALAAVMGARRQIGPGEPRDTLQ